MIPIKPTGNDGPSGHKQAVPEASPSRIVPKPVPQRQLNDPRGYQIEQLRKRFSPKESTLENSTTSLVFKLVPSDPDFPFELVHLDCDIHVPASYPKAPPILHVRNKDIPRGFGINIEKGWDKLVQTKQGATLLALTNALDRGLESFLSEQKAETVKMTIFKDTRHLENSVKAGETTIFMTPMAPKVAEPERRYIPTEVFTKDEIAAAKSRRAQETRQLEARMGREPLYHRSSDGIVYTLPLDPKRRSSLPVGIQAVRSFQLIIPLLYPLQSVRILLNDVEESTEAEATEELFVEKAAEQKQMNLMSHVNYLTQNLHVLAQRAISRPTPTPPVLAPLAEEVVRGESNTHSATSEDAKSHIQVIPRPPEWTCGRDSEDSDSEDSFDSGESEDGGATLNPASSKTPTTAIHSERGTALSFPSVQLHGIELLQVSILSLSVKCERCKTLNEIEGLNPNIEKTTSCKKCATTFAVKFRPGLVHENSTRAGFIDAAGCTVSDLLPSVFVPTCANCSTAAQGIVSVRGETTTNVCRECHARFTFALPDVKFLAYAPGSSILPPSSGPRRKTEKLGLHAGEALPDRGACAHYRRSYRWFRFRCCSKVFPCDRCHDAAEEHMNEWANRMICGWCSREQNYSVESCAFCGRSVIGKRGKGYWEGGKGTRNKTLMRRGDKRKYKRIGGGESRKAE